MWLRSALITVTKIELSKKKFAQICSNLCFGTHFNWTNLFTQKPLVDRLFTCLVGLKSIMWFSPLHLVESQSPLLRHFPKSSKHHISSKLFFYQNWEFYVLKKIGHRNFFYQPCVYRSKRRFFLKLKEGIVYVCVVANVKSGLE